MRRLFLLQPLVLERVPHDTEARQGGPASWIHTKVTPHPPPPPAPRSAFVKGR